MQHRKLSVTEMNRLDVESFRQAQKVPLVVVLDNVRSQHNIGAVFRTADAFLLEGVCLCGICCCPPNQEIHKTALGAELTVDWHYYEHTTDAVADLKRQGYKIYSVEQAVDSLRLEQLMFEAGDKVAVVLGHEVFGVQQEVIDLSDGVIEIPQYGTKHSLNVSVTAGIVMFELAAKLNKGLI